MSTASAARAAAQRRRRRGGGNFADGVVNSALRFRAQAPLVDQLLREIGIEGGDIQRLVGGASGAQAALPPAAAPKE